MRRSRKQRERIASRFWRIRGADEREALAFVRRRTQVGASRDAPRPFPSVIAIVLAASSAFVEPSMALSVLDTRVSACPDAPFLLAPRRSKQQGALVSPATRPLGCASREPRRGPRVPSRVSALNHWVSSTGLPWRRRSRDPCRARNRTVSPVGHANGPLTLTTDLLRRSRPNDQIRPPRTPDRECARRHCCCASRSERHDHPNSLASQGAPDGGQRAVMPSRLLPKRSSRSLRKRSISQPRAREGCLPWLSPSCKKTPRGERGFLDAPEKTRTSTDQTVHKALNLARLPIPPQARGREV